MNYVSTKNHSALFTFETAVRQGLPPDNGLYMPESIPVLSNSFIANLKNFSLPEIGLQILAPFIGDAIRKGSLSDLIYDAFSFDTPLVNLKQDLFSLELFKGPTFAFKDVGARFMARVLGEFNQVSDKRITVLVATSGDTGGAVANGFLGVKNVDVCILYPKGKISDFQQRQMTTLGQNIHVLEIDGTFDDCQRLVKTAFLDKGLSNQLGLTSANSINIARLLPQMLYYFYAYGQLARSGKPVVFSVPSGNYGNLTAGIIAWKMGLPISRFIASSNANDVVPQFLSSGQYIPKPSIQTISNAMDVGDPSNFVRLQYLFNHDLSEFQSIVSGFSFSDEDTKVAIKEIHDQFGYTADPHGAVAYLGLKEYLKTNMASGVFLETAHPVKFGDIVEEVLGVSLELPDSCLENFEKNVQVAECPMDYEDFKYSITQIIEH